MQHIIVETCDQPNPDDADAKREGGAWEFNGDGRTVSHDFGFGVMNAAKMILAAKNWTTVPERKQCTVGEVDEGLWSVFRSVWYREIFPLLFNSRPLSSIFTIRRGELEEGFFNQFIGVNFESGNETVEKIGSGLGTVHISVFERTRN